MDNIQTESCCMTPPKASKNEQGIHTPESITPLVTSPLTPYSTVESPFSVTLTDSENDTLEMMLKRSDTHWKGESQLQANIISAGNALYIQDRPIIVEWMTEVCSSFQFQQVTLHVAVRHMDWFMSKQALRKHSWQLCAVASLFIASKGEEAGSKVPEMHSLKHICGGAFSEDLIRCMELCILNCLDWDMVTKTAVHFTDQFMSIIYRLVDQGLLSNMLGSYEKQMENFIPRTATLLEFSSEDDDQSDQDSTYEPDDEELCISDDEDDMEIDDLLDDDILDIDDNILFSQPRPTSAYPDQSLKSAIDTYHRTAKCILDLSLYDLSLRNKFSPNVVAAAALSVACDVSKGFCPTNKDINAITGISEYEMYDCRHILWKKFQRLQH